MNFSELMSAATVDGATVSLNITEDWLQGRTAFGGLQAALALRAMRTVVPEAPLRTLQGTFLAPVPAGRASATAKILRAGKSATHVEVRLMDGEATAALLVGVFGTARESVVKLSPVRPEVTNGHAKPIPLPYVPGVVPAFTQHFEAKWLSGMPPFTAKGMPTQQIELSLRDPGPVTEYHVLALADFIPPVALSYLKQPAPGATMTWMIEMLAEKFGSSCSGWRVEAHLDAARDGYTSQGLTLFAPDGTPVCLSHQNMVVFG